MIERILDIGDLSKSHLRAWEALVRSHGALIKVISARMDAECCIGLATYEVLLSLEQAPHQRLTMGELAGIVILSPSGVTRLVDRLEKQGLVAREVNPNDKRSFHTVLTEAGLKEREKAWPVFRAGIRESFVAHMSEAEADELTECLLKFVKKGIGAAVHL